MCYNGSIMEEITLTRDQKNALGAILTWLRAGTKQYLTVGGYAGTGKTTLIAAIREAMAQQSGWGDTSVAFCSFTGKAANVLEQKLRSSQVLQEHDSCSTIHRLIYEPAYDAEDRFVGFRRVRNISKDVIIVDEGSMVREDVWRDILSFQKPVLVVGDHGQLPPVGDRFHLMAHPAVTLQEVVRQATGNPIIELSRGIQRGEEVPFGNYQDVIHKMPLEEAENEGVVDQLFARYSRDMHVLCAKNGTRVALNNRIRSSLGFRQPEPIEGDRVVCLRNNYYYGIYNGMLGTIMRIRNDPPHWYRARVALEESDREFYGSISKHQFGKHYTLTPSSLSAIDADLRWKEVGCLFDWGYALTVHKAQGSEAETVVVFEEYSDAQSQEERRRWLYTAVTRATGRVYIFTPTEPMGEDEISLD